MRWHGNSQFGIAAGIVVLGLLGAIAPAGLSSLRQEGSSPPDPNRALQAGSARRPGNGSRTKRPEIPVFRQWRNFTVADGLPSNKAFCVRSDGPRVWVGTDRGLARYESGKWKVYGTDDGLPHRVVLSLDVSPRTGDLWIGTMGGLARYSAGRIDRFTQTNSGLSNDFVNDVECDPEKPQIWVATAMGVCRFDLWSGQWSVFTHENTPLHEPWTYSVSIDRGLVYVGAWGAGILEYQKETGRWREYRDPDKEMEIDLFPDDGPVHDVTASVDFRSGVLWQATYVGLARYDGRRWWSYFAEDSGLASNFINFVRARGRVAWLATDKGLSATDGEQWVTYRRREGGRGEVLFYQGDRLLRRSVLTSVFAHNFALGVDFQGEDIWLATEGGVSLGRTSSTAVEQPILEGPGGRLKDQGTRRSPFQKE